MVRWKTRTLFVKSPILDVGSKEMASLSWDLLVGMGNVQKCQALIEKAENWSLLVSYLMVLWKARTFFVKSPILDVGGKEMASLSWDVLVGTGNVQKCQALIEKAENWSLLVSYYYCQNNLCMPELNPWMHFFIVALIILEK